MIPACPNPKRLTEEWPKYKFKNKKREMDDDVFKNILEKAKKKENNFMNSITRGMLKVAQMVSTEKAEESLDDAIKRDKNVNVSNVIEKYQIIGKLAAKDMGLWQNYQDTGVPKGFIEDISQYDETNWKEISSKLDTVIKDLDTVVIG